MPLDELLSLCQEKFSSTLLPSPLQIDQKEIKVEKANLFELLSFLKTTPYPGFEQLIDVTAVDYLQPQPLTEVHYQLHHPDSLERIRVICSLPRGGTLPSILSLWPGANWYEREIYDLFGVIFSDHPQLTRLLTPDDTLGHPLRRDFPLTEEAVEFKHGVQPKVPSEIIPHVAAQRNR